MHLLESHTLSSVRWRARSVTSRTTHALPARSTAVSRQRAVATLLLSDGSKKREQCRIEGSLVRPRIRARAERAPRSLALGEQRVRGGAALPLLLSDTLGLVEGRDGKGGASSFGGILGFEWTLPVGDNVGEWQATPHLTRRARWVGRLRHPSPY